MVAERSYKPKDLRDALTKRKELGAIPYAGGTDLMVKGRRWSGLTPFFDRPVIFIGHLPELQKVECKLNSIKISSACTLSALLENERVPEILKIAVREIGSPAIRNIATIGGNICNASPAGDTLPILYALDASLILENKYGKRTIPIEQFIKAPGETVLQDSELLTRILVPIQDYNVVYYRKVGTRRANSLSKLSFLGLAKIVRGRVEDIKISFGAIAPTVVRSRAIENRIKGRAKGDIVGVISEINTLYTSIINPIDDQRSTAHYRRDISLKFLNYFLSEELISRL